MNKAKIKVWYRKNKTIGLAVLIGSFFLMNWWMLSRIQDSGQTRGEIKVKLLKANSSTVSIREELEKLGRGRKPQKTIFARLLSKAAHALAEVCSNLRNRTSRSLRACGWNLTSVLLPGLLVLRHEIGNLVSVESYETNLRGLCPLMPEETVLMLAAFGFHRRSHIYLAGAHIYGGKSRLAALTTLFPNLVTKENLLSPAEIEPFANFSSPLAALDFIVCTASDVLAMTDSGSQFSSLAAGYRIYYVGEDAINQAKQTEACGHICEKQHNRVEGISDESEEGREAK